MATQATRRASAHPRIVQVVEDDMCIACGACIHACPEDAIAPRFDEYRGAHEVHIVDAASCPDCPAPCDAVCPSIEVDVRQLLERSSPEVEVDRPGPIRSISLGYSRAYRDNGISSSGGILRALLATALERGQPVVCLARSDVGYSAELLRDSADLDRVPGSIYHSVSFTDAIGALKRLESPCVLVATPCQLEGITKYIDEVDPALGQVIGLRAGLVCGWMYSDHALRAFASYKGIREPIVDATYRGDGEVGLLKLITRDETHAYDRRAFETLSARLDYQASFSTAMNRLRCRVCEDHTNVLADIAIGDAWLERKLGEKLSIIVTRTDAGVAALEELVSSCDVVLEESYFADLIESQSQNLVYGIEARKLNSFLRERGVITPSFRFSAEPLPPERLGLRKRLEFTYELWLRRKIRMRSYSAFRRGYVPRLVRRAVSGRARHLATSLKRLTERARP